MLMMFHQKLFMLVSLILSETVPEKKNVVVNRYPPETLISTTMDDGPRLNV